MTEPRTIQERLAAERSPFAGFGRRLADGWSFARAGWRHPEFWRQVSYGVAPRRYFEKTEPPADVFYLFRDVPARREMLRRLQAGETSGLAGGQLFGFAELRKKGLAVDCNLRLPRISSVRETVAGWIEKAYAPRTGIGLGDVCSVRAHLWQMNRARVVVATTDNTGLPAARLKARGRLRVPLVYVSVGLPERIESAAAKSPARAARYRKRLASVDRFLAYGYAEAEWLRQWLGNPEKVRFLPFGVDTEKWRPEDGVQETTDVLSVGSDPKRDFGLLVEYARQRPGVGVCLVVGRDGAAGLGPLPPNVEVRVQVPVEEVKNAIARARVVVLPVKENTYSGATTTLLQCLAMGKAVAVSRVGAIRAGYGFEDGVNLRWMEPGSAESLACAVDSLMADAAVRRRIGAAARRHVEENLNWERYVRGIESGLAVGLDKEKAT